MKKLLMALCVAGAMAFTAGTITGCGGECKKLCEKMAGCMKDMGGKAEAMPIDSCTKACKKNKDPFKKSVEQTCKAAKQMKDAKEKMKK